LSKPDEEALGQTAPIEVPKEEPSPAAEPVPAPAPAPAPAPPPPEPPPAVDNQVVDSDAAMAMPAAPGQTQPVYVPLAVTIGDGFKFGCGFFLSWVLVMLVGFVLLAALFVVTSLLGLNLPLTR
jgi:hypothetical protein